jgi:tetratricopeptide (TPR) repeat protein
MRATNICTLVFLAISAFCPSLPAEETLPGGVVYGPKAAFNIAAPEGWVVDNESGKAQGLPCVLYPKGSSWSDAKTVMYANMASPQWEGVNAFVAMAIKEMKATHGTPREKIASGKTKDGHDYFINEYPATKTYSQWERVGYVQLPLGVAYIVLSSRDHAGYEKDSGALEKVLKTLVYLEPKADSSSPSAVSASPTPAATASRFTSLAEALAEAKRLGETSEGKRYDSEFGTAMQAARPELADVVHECAKDSKLPIVFDVVFIFAADGRVESTLQTPDQSAAVCVADKLRNVRLPAPPRAGWPVQLHIELNPGNEEMKKRTGPNPATSKDMQLAMQAGKAKAAGDYEEALRLYARAIKLNGHFAPFVYQNRGMLYLNRAKESTDRQARIADLQKAIADFKKSIALGAASDDELNRGLEKVGTKANLEEAAKLLAQETGQ